MTNDSNLNQCLILKTEIEGMSHFSIWTEYKFCILGERVRNTISLTLDNEINVKNISWFNVTLRKNNICGGKLMAKQS